jgi:hypothetical protein
VRNLITPFFARLCVRRVPAFTSQLMFLCTIKFSVCGFCIQLSCKNMGSRGGQPKKIKYDSGLDCCLNGEGRTAAWAHMATRRHRHERKALHNRIFCILILHRKKIHVWTLENFNVIFGPFTRRCSLWRRGNTARRHRLWRRGTCCVGTNGRRGADVVPSSAP